jgi:hypothetical protein
MVKLHEQLDGLKEEEVVKIRWDKALILVKSLEPTCNQFE